MAILDIDVLRATGLSPDPFDHLVARSCLRGETVADLRRDFPQLPGPGSIPVQGLTYGPSFGALLEELRGPAFARVVAEKFDEDLEGRPVMITVRGYCRLTDGKIHTDSGGKLLTILLYMNPDWATSAGHLRLLRSGTDLDDYAAEVAPEEGTLLAFRCTDNAWHGHTSFAGERRCLQLNWVKSTRYLKREQLRHSISAFFKRRKAS